MNWDKETSERLRELWDDAGWSARQIGIELGCTKNAIIGRAHRMKLGERPSPIKREKREAPVEKKKRSSHVKKSDVVASKGVVPMVGEEYLGELFVPLLRNTDRRHRGRGVALVDLGERSCHFPLGDPKSPNFGFCGAKTPVDKVYCHHHQHVCYAPSAPARRRSK